MNYSLNGRKIRQSQANYSYSVSGVRAVNGRAAAEASTKNASKPGSHRLWWLVVLVIVAAGGGSGYALTRHKSSPKLSVHPALQRASTPAATPKVSTPAVATAPAVNYCASNTLSQNVVVSISQRHLWACAGSVSQYDSPVVTGIAYLAADLTPTGTYHIYGKITNTVLTGSDSTGSWRDPVSYWMPFLDNQYGAYGFHDATWRANSDFGNISPNSADASHGCVELPLSTAAWLYNWASIGTTVTIQA